VAKQKEVVNRNIPKRVNIIKDLVSSDID